MARLFKILAALLALLVLLLVGAVLALQQWTGSADFRQRIEQQAATALGVPVQLGRIAVTLWPLPAVALDAIVVKTEPALTVERVQARPQWSALLGGRLVVDTLVLRKAVLPQRAINTLSESMHKRKPAPAVKPAAQKTADVDWLPRRAVVEGLTWVNLQGQATTIEADARLDDAGWPESLNFKITQGALAGTQATLSAQDASATQRVWALKIALGGGTLQGPLRLTPAPRSGAEIALQAEVETRDVEVSALTAPHKLLTGKLEARTTLNAKFAEPASLVDALQSQTTFTVRGAALQGIDLAKAVRTVGLNRGGETRLDTLAGQVATHGRAVSLSNLVANSGVLAASGNATISPTRALSGRISVDLGSKVVGVPLVLGGTLDAPEVTLSRSALLGAAIGTAVLPGVGTGAGAKLGDRLGESMKQLFGK